MSKKKSNFTKPDAPKVYTSSTHPGICMSSKACKTKADFIRLFERTKNARGADLDKEWTRFQNWRRKYKD